MPKSLRPQFRPDVSPVEPGPPGLPQYTYGSTGQNAYDLAIRRTETLPGAASFRDQYEYLRSTFRFGPEVVAQTEIVLPAYFRFMRRYNIPNHPGLPKDIRDAMLRVRYHAQLTPVLIEWIMAVGDEIQEERLHSMLSPQAPARSVRSDVIRSNEKAGFGDAEGYSIHQVGWAPPRNPIPGGTPRGVPSTSSSSPANTSSSSTSFPSSMSAASTAEESARMAEQLRVRAQGTETTGSSIPSRGSVASTSEPPSTVRMGVPGVGPDGRPQPSRLIVDPRKVGRTDFPRAPPELRAKVEAFKLASAMKQRGGAPLPGPSQGSSSPTPSATTKKPEEKKG